MCNFDLEAIPNVNHRMHLYLGKAKVSCYLSYSEIFSI